MAEGQRPWLVTIFILCLLLIAAFIAIGVLATRQRTDKNIKIPDLQMHPNPDGDSFIRFKQGLESTYQKYTSDLQKYLEDYSDDKQLGGSFVDCSDGTRPGPNKVCRVPLTDLGSSCTHSMDFGFYEGQPCILLNMEKIFNFSTSGLCNVTMPAELRELNPDLSPHSVVLTCDGANTPSKDNVGSFKYWPTTGFATKYLPYLDQPNYLSPLVMVQFQNPRPGIVIDVVCKIWADVIRHSGTNKKEGTVAFSIMVD